MAGPNKQELIGGADRQLHDGLILPHASGLEVHERLKTCQPEKTKHNEQTFFRKYKRTCVRSCDINTNEDSDGRACSFRRHVDGQGWGGSRRCGAWLFVLLKVTEASGRHIAYIRDRLSIETTAHLKIVSAELSFVSYYGHSSSTRSFMRFWCLSVPMVRLLLWLIFTEGGIRCITQPGE